MQLFIDLDVVKLSEDSGVFGIANLPGVFVVDLYTILKEFFTPIKSLEDAIANGGYIGTFLNFKITARSHVLAYSNDSKPVLRKYVDGFKLQAGDNQAGLFWHPLLVRRYEGNVGFYEKNQNAQFHADLMSSGGYGGGSLARLDGVGSFALMQSDA